MSKNLSHQEWVLEQFTPKYLKTSYRNAVLHSSIIEGVLVVESRINKFDYANKFLLCDKKIDSSEFCIFNKIRDIRNRLVHRIFKKRGLSQNEINKLIKDLVQEILLAYKKSAFLDKKLFEKYQIPRPQNIKPDLTDQTK